MIAGLDLSPSSTGLVLLDGDQAPVCYHLKQENTKESWDARRSIADQVLNVLSDNAPIRLVALEDYALGAGNQVGYQIAEVGAMVKWRILTWLMTPIVLVANNKRTSYVERRKGVTKKECVQWAIEHGCPLPFKSRGKDDGYNSREREDLADAFIVGKIGEDTLAAWEQRLEPVKGHIVLDSDTGTAFNRRTILRVR